MHRDEFRRDDLPFLAIEEETIACVPNEPVEKPDL